MTRWKKVLAPWLVFLLGIVCGVAGTSVVIAQRARGFLRSSPDEMVEVTTGIIARRLDLDDEQRRALQPVVDDLKREIIAMRLESIPRWRTIIADAEERARPHLRPDQQEKLGRMLTPLRARWNLTVPEPPPPEANR